MQRTSSVLLVIGVLFAGMVVVPGARSWGNGGWSADPLNPDYGIHDWIAEKALDMQVIDVTFLKTTYHSEYLYGTEWPDNPSNIGDTFNHHVYYFATGALQADIGAVRAQAMYNQALTYLASSDYRNAAYYIGAMTHYIADLGVFGHTMGAATDWGAEVHHTSDYEPWFNLNIGSLRTPTGISLFDLDARSATLSLAFDITFGLGPIKANIWMDANYNWADSVFKSSALASLNESVEAVAAALNHLLIGQIIPEFGSPASMIGVAVIMVAIMIVMRRRNESKIDGVISQRWLAEREYQRRRRSSVEAAEDKKDGT